MTEHLRYVGQPWPRMEVYIVVNKGDDREPSCIVGTDPAAVQVLDVAVADVVVAGGGEIRLCHYSQKANLVQKVTSREVIFLKLWRVLCLMV